MSQCLIHHIDGTKAAPTISGTTITVEASTALDTWNQDDMIVKATITLNMTDLMGCGIDPITTTAREFWVGLVAVWERRNELTAMNAEEYLKACKYVPGTNMMAHFEELQRRRKVCRDLGSPMTEQCFAVHVCHSLGDSMCHITSPLLTQTDPEAVMSTILAIHENKLLQSGRPQNPIGETRSSNGAPVTSVFMTAAKAELICAWCGWKKHTKENCYCIGGGKAGQQPSHWKTQPRPKKGSPADLAMQAMQATVAPVPPASPTTIPTAKLAETNQTTSVPYHIFLASATDMTATPNTPTAMTTYHAFLDSGASHHYFTARELFSDYLPLTPQAGNSAKCGASFTIIGVGTVHTSIIVNGKPSIIAFRNALHTPDLSANLISLSRIDAAGGRIQMQSGLMEITRRHGNLMIVGHVGSNNLYEVSFTKVPDETVSKLPKSDITHDPRALASLSNQSLADIHTWHRRFGHISERSVTEMVRSGAVGGMKIVGSSPSGKCEDCIKGKHPRAPFSSAERKDDVLDLVEIDLTGHARVESLGGAYHGMTFDNNCSSFGVLDLLRTKEATETLQSLKHYHAMAERTTGKKLKAIRTDNGPEFVNALWSAYTKEHGIIHELTTPYTPQQDGMTERGHRTIGDHAQAMLFDAQLPEYM